MKNKTHMISTRNRVMSQALQRPKRPAKLQPASKINSHNFKAKRSWTPKLKKLLMRTFWIKITLILRKMKLTNSSKTGRYNFRTKVSCSGRLTTISSIHTRVNKPSWTHFASWAALSTYQTYASRLLTSRTPNGFQLRSETYGLKHLRFALSLFSATMPFSLSSATSALTMNTTKSGRIHHISKSSQMNVVTLTQTRQKMKQRPLKRKLSSLKSGRRSTKSHAQPCKDFVR